MIRVLLLGASGQLGRCLQDRCPEDWDLQAPGSAQLDISDEPAVARAVAQARPELIINAAAYNRVDQAERDPGLAYAVNAAGPGHLAAAAAKFNARLIHLSTDYVFDGFADSDGLPGAPHAMRNQPYTETDAPRPLSVYGKSKLAGEQAVLRAQPGAIVIRTSWLYSEYGHNFVKTILDAAQAGRPLRVVDDQTGSPTYAGDLAGALIRLGGCAGIPDGLYHYSGGCALSWYAFARRIVSLAGYGATSLTPALSPSSSDGGAAARPGYSVLSCARIRRHGIIPAPIDAGLTYVIQRLSQGPPGGSRPAPAID